MKDSPYRRKIAKTAAELGFVGMDPRHIEAWMRSENETLDSLTSDRFRMEVQLACEICAFAPKSTSEELAASFGI